jgi:predicted small lipoprotein YifL
MNRKMAITAALGFSVLLALGACGRKGDLELPPGVSPDMAAKAPGCGNAATQASTQNEPVDMQHPGSMTSPNQMPDTTVPPC